MLGSAFTSMMDGMVYLWTVELHFASLWSYSILENELQRILAKNPTLLRRIYSHAHMSMSNSISCNPAHTHDLIVSHERILSLHHLVIVPVP